MFKKFAENSIFHIILLSFIAVLTFLPTLENFFYLDEWGALYDFTHSEYKFYIFTTHLFYLLYSLFDINAIGHFGVGIAIYTLSVVLFYFFISQLLSSKMLGVIAGLILATSPIGTDTTTMIWTYVAEGGYPLTVGLLILLLLYFKFFKERKVAYFLVVLLGFFLFLELEPRRVFLYLPIIILFDYIFNFKRIIPSLSFVARALALFLTFIVYYRYNVTLTGIIQTGKIIFNESATTLDGQAKFQLFLESLTHIKPLVTFTNVLLAGPWIFISDRLIGYVDLADVTHVYLLVIVTFALVATILVLAFKTKRELGLLLIFALGWIYINIIGIYVFSSSGISGATHRTLSLAAPAYALFYTISGFTLYSFLKKRIHSTLSVRSGLSLDRIFVCGFVFFLGLNFLATRYSFEKFNDFHSRPARAFFKDLKIFYPTLPANSMIYIQTPDNPQIKYKLSRIYGGSPWGGGATLAVFYPELKKEEIAVVREYIEVKEFVENDLSKIDHVFAFYFDENGLSDQTAKFRSQLQKYP